MNDKALELSFVPKGEILSNQKNIRPLETALMFRLTYYVLRNAIQ